MLREDIRITYIIFLDKYKPIIIHTKNRNHVRTFKWTINSKLHKILKAGKNGTKGTLKRSLSEL